MLKKTGVPTKEDIEKILPPDSIREGGPYVIMECFEEIPCDPCYTSCPTGAVEKFDNINDLPKINFPKCTGCGICISKCPGVAVFVIDETYSPKKSLVKIPYEFVPLPEQAQKVAGLDREGKSVCKVKIVKVQKTKSKTTILWLEVPKKFTHEVRNISLNE